MYSAGLATVWGVALILTRVIKGADDVQPVLLVFGGYCLGWVSTTIARYVYPPPQRWASNRRDE